MGGSGYVRIDPLATGDVDGLCVVEVMEDTSLDTAWKETCVEAGRSDENWDGEVDDSPDWTVDPDPSEDDMDGEPDTPSVGAR